MMILLTTFIMLLAVGGSWTSIRQRTHSYYGLLLVLTTGMLGVFVALDLFLFYVMWEVMLVPMYFIVGIWGGDRRIYASVKFFLYTMVGSMLMLAAIVYLGLQTRSPVTGLPNFSSTTSSPRPSRPRRRSGFGASPGVRVVPMFPFTWLPDARRGADRGLGGLAMCSLGTFGYPSRGAALPGAAMVRRFGHHPRARGDRYRLRRSCPSWPDFKKLVAYSSVSHPV